MGITDEVKTLIESGPNDHKRLDNIARLRELVRTKKEQGVLLEPKPKFPTLLESTRWSSRALFGKNGS